MLSWFRKGKKKNEGGGYRKDRPPEDDCCPICFDDFHVPCRTNCGHWFCGSCLLWLSRFMANFRLFICPMCQSCVYKLVPHSPVLIQPGREEVGEILGEIKQFNCVDEFVLPIEEELLIEVVDFMLGAMWLIILLTQSFYVIEDFLYWSNEGIEFRVIQILRCALLVLGIWMSRRHLRRDRI
ncbi:E3 ubiquitin ligase TRIM40-like isoform X2 [Salvia hispanica]|uniref:E3 ubiquitin ligase TRIM40-like isoform X2 n=1 Tax=Salvia hispanica TaxID=49212 RepID=UPI00200992A5|nr:E3 ubiquitin ligase TRIM40-like isoform X2 [Salvia hispanica]